jgi:hypothetical protein
MAVPFPVGRNTVSRGYQSVACGGWHRASPIAKLAFGMDVMDASGR